MVFEPQQAFPHSTIYIIGSGPTLADHSAQLLEKLSGKICVGVNRTQYLVTPTVFMSSYISEVLLAQAVCPRAHLIHTRAVSEAPLVPGIETLKRVYRETPDDLSNTFDPNDRFLITRNNVIFLATHLALIMGARRIVYIGCEQRNGLHFYNSRPELLERIVFDMCGVIAHNKHLLGTDHPYETPANIMRATTADTEILRNRKFYDMDHTDLLSQWFRKMRGDFGVEIFSCAQDSIMVDAGAHFVDLTSALDSFE